MNARVYIFVRLCSYSQHPGFLFGTAHRRRKRTGKKRTKSTGEREAEWDPLKEIYSTEQRMRSFRESGHRHSARNSRARPRGVRTTPVGFLGVVIGARWLQAIDYDRFHLFSVDYFFSFWYHLFSTSPLSSSSPASLPSPSLSLLLCAGKLLVRFVGIAFRC